MKRPPPMPARQHGAVLFVALIMLLIITLLAVTSMREVTLESRITGNLMEEKRLRSAAESAQREAERRLANVNVAPEACTSTTPTTLCIQEIVPNTTDGYKTFFTTSTGKGYFTYSGLDGGTTLDRTARWYVRDATSVGNIQTTCTQTEDYLSGNNCVNYYEVNAQSFQDSGASKSCGADALCVRSVVAAIYN